MNFTDIFVNRHNKKKQDKLNKDIQRLERFGFQKFGDFTHQDVFITGYPKSGNTLLQCLVAYLVYGLRKDAPISLINSCVTEYYNNPYFFRYGSRHFFKSHELPNPSYKNVIYIVRDGRDAVRSYYYMRTNMGKEENMNELYMNGGKTFVGTWSDHVNEWVKNPFSSNILFIKFEDLVKQKREVIHQILNFLELERSEIEINQVIEASSFENMKDLENTDGWSKLKTSQGWSKEGKFVREGKVNNFNNDSKISNESLEKFTKLSIDMLRHFNYV